MDFTRKFKETRRERERELVESDAFDGGGDFGSYYAYRKGVSKNFIKLHAVSDENLAHNYVNALKYFLLHNGKLLKGNILDIGCSIGTITNQLRLASSDGKSFGIDISEDALVVAKEKYPDCLFYSQSADKLDMFPDKYFDIIHAREFYPFTRTNDKEYHLGYLTLFVKKLKNDGCVILNMDSLKVGFVNTFPEIKMQLYQLGYKKLLKEPAPINVSKFLAFSYKYPECYKTAQLLSKALKKVTLKPEVCFYLLDKS